MYLYNLTIYKINDIIKFLEKFNTIISKFINEYEYNDIKNYSNIEYIQKYFIYKYIINNDNKSIFINRNHITIDIFIREINDKNKIIDKFLSSR